MKEYRVVSTKKSGPFIESDSISDAEKELNFYAAQGWRLVSVTRSMADGSAYYFQLFLERDK